MSKAVSARDTRRGSRPRRDRLAFTLVEVLVATGLTLLLLVSVAGVFALVSTSISDARGTIEMNERVRGAQNTLQRDLKGLTARGIPPLDPAKSPGYLEIIEGPIGPCQSADTVQVVVGAPSSSSGDVGKILLTSADEQAAAGKNQTYGSDTTVGDIDDILQFTTRSTDVPFTGRGGPTSYAVNAAITEAQSNIAEVAWFVRGRTLYRRVLLVDPTYDAGIYTNDGAWNFTGRSYYDLCDISVRQVGGDYDPTTKEFPRLVANSLSDLTKRENRFGHPPMIGQAPPSGPSFLGPATLVTNWPNDARFWGPLGLPTLRECSDPNWPLPFYAPHNAALRVGAGVVNPFRQMEQSTAIFSQYPALSYPAKDVQFDAWTEPRRWSGIDISTGGVIDASVPQVNGQVEAPLMYPGRRYADDVILNNVIGFDVKVWDSGAPIFKREMRVGVQDGVTQTVTVAPGEPGYVQCLYDLQSDPTEVRFLPVAYGAYVDLGWAVDPNWKQFNTSEQIDKYWLYPPKNSWPPGTANYRPPVFHHPGNPMSGLWAVPSNQDPNNTSPLPDFRARVYDTGSSHYERDGVAQKVADPRQWQWDSTGAPKNDYPDEATDGLDTSGPGIDDASEREAPPPYDAAMKAIQVKIRVFEPDSRQIREVTVVQELVSQ